MAKVLMIDDSAMIRKLVQVILENEGHHMIEAKDGPLGIALARAEVPDLIILDLVMPYMNGDQVAHYLNDDEVLSKIPVIILSSTTEHDAVVGVLTLENVHNYILKPIEVDTLLQRIRPLLNKDTPASSQE